MSHRHNYTMSPEYWLGATSTLSSYLPGSTITTLKTALQLGTQFFSQFLSLLSAFTLKACLAHHLYPPPSAHRNSHPQTLYHVYKASDSKASSPLLLPGSVLSQRNRDPFCIQLNHLINYLWTKT